MQQMNTDTVTHPPVVQYAIHDGHELLTIIHAVSFYPPASAGPGHTGNLVFHNADGLPTAAVANGCWTHAQPFTPIPDTIPQNFGTVKT